MGQQPKKGGRGRGWKKGQKDEANSDITQNVISGELEDFDQGKMKAEKKGKKRHRKREEKGERMKERTIRILTRRQGY